MPRCMHDPISLSIQITRRIIGTVTDMGHTTISHNLPETVRIEAVCLACGYANSMTSYTDETPGWQRWPKWLLYRLTLMRHSQPELHEAMTALGIPEDGKEIGA